MLAFIFRIFLKVIKIIYFILCKKKNYLFRVQNSWELLLKDCTAYFYFFPLRNINMPKCKILFNIYEGYFIQKQKFDNL